MGISREEREAFRLGLKFGSFILHPDVGDTPVPRPCRHQHSSDHLFEAAEEMPDRAVDAYLDACKRCGVALNVRPQA